MLGRQIGWPRPLCPNNTPLQRCLGSPPPSTALCPAASVTPLSVCVYGSSNCCRFIRLHISVVSMEPTPAPLVALLVCLPAAAVTVEVERARWLKSPQQAYCCRSSHFSIYGSVYLVQALSVCTVIKILWLSWITMVPNTEGVSMSMCVSNIGILRSVVCSIPSLHIMWNKCGTRHIGTQAECESRTQKSAHGLAVLSRDPCQTLFFKKCSDQHGGEHFKTVAWLNKWRRRYVSRMSLSCVSWEKDWTKDRFYVFKSFWAH